MDEQPTLPGAILNGIRRITGVVSIRDIQRPVRTLEDIPTGVKGGQKTVTTAGTAVVLGDSIEIVAVRIVAERTNTGIIYVSDSTVDSSSFKLLRGDEVTIAIDNLSKISLDASVDAQSVSYLYVTR